MLGRVMRWELGLEKCHHLFMLLDTDIEILLKPIKLPCQMCRKSVNNFYFILFWEESY